MNKADTMLLATLRTASINGLLQAGYYENIEVIGTYISPIQPTWIPPNLNSFQIPYVGAVFHVLGPVQKVIQDKSNVVPFGSEIESCSSP